MATKRSKVPLGTPRGVKPVGVPTFAVEGGLINDRSGQATRRAKQRGYRLDGGFYGHTDPTAIGKRGQVQTTAHDAC